MSLLGKTKAELAKYAKVLRHTETEAESLNDDFEPVVVREKNEKAEESSVEKIVCSSCKKEIPVSVMKKKSVGLSGI